MSEREIGKNGGKTRTKKRDIFLRGSITESMHSRLRVRSSMLLLLLPYTTIKYCTESAVSNGWMKHCMKAVPISSSSSFLEEEAVNIPYHIKRRGPPFSSSSTWLRVTIPVSNLSSVDAQGLPPPLLAWPFTSFDLSFSSLSVSGHRGSLSRCCFFLLLLLPAQIPISLPSPPPPPTSLFLPHPSQQFWPGEISYSVRGILFPTLTSLMPPLKLNVADKRRGNWVEGGGRRGRRRTSTVHART